MSTAMPSTIGSYFLTYLALFYLSLGAHVSHLFVHDHGTHAHDHGVGVGEEQCDHFPATSLALVNPTDHDDNSSCQVCTYLASCYAIKHGSSSHSSFQAGESAVRLDYGQSALSRPQSGFTIRGPPQDIPG